MAERARQVNVDYIARARTLDHKHSKQPDGTPYPGVREQVRDHLTGPVLTCAGRRLGTGGLITCRLRGHLLRMRWLVDLRSEPSSS